ncbi:hypothetical protein [Bradyrhizobium australafricanum]|uniref:hypothetical protein n=1 Tax=Bradyrhizobium australafricanum TaxID=2821406 RepID=UPI001CE2C48B|nr:hypothetical protein [Bradyrhizobium australafricanum]MCA6098889.1 hypothetical protein [Bradyrhizobium australafricanum]
MKKLVLAVSLMFAATAAQAQWTNPNTHTSSGYTRSNGTYVQPLRRNQSVHGRRWASDIAILTAGFLDGG